MKRTGEIVASWILIVIIVVFLGGFSLVMNTLDEKEFSKRIYPLLDSQKSGLSEAQMYEQFKTMGMWFGLTLMVLLVLMILSLFFLSGKYWWISPLLYTMSGVVLLLGTQFLLYPLAFFFFVLAGVVFVRNRKLKLLSEEIEER